ncbi:hypothetical protein V1477_002523 [Vespula maculifrons]|uniref:Uncharacterized protein n=1 Tax=Vespula maculifrons TaxID=7453 RepID=A0ABD2CZK6_VESMC
MEEERTPSTITKRGRNPVFPKDISKETIISLMSLLLNTHDVTTVKDRAFPHQQHRIAYINNVNATRVDSLKGQSVELVVRRKYPTCMRNKAYREMMRSLSIRDNGTYDECDSGAYTYSSRMRDLKKRKIVDLGNGECLYCHHPLNQPTTTTTITSPWDPRIFHSAFTKADSLISGVCRRLVLPVHTYTIASITDARSLPVEKNPEFRKRYSYHRTLVRHNQIRVVTRMDKRERDARATGRRRIRERECQYLKMAKGTPGKAHRLGTNNNNYYYDDNKDTYTLRSDLEGLPRTLFSRFTDSYRLVVVRGTFFCIVRSLKRKSEKISDRCDKERSIKQTCNINMYRKACGTFQTGKTRSKKQAAFIILRTYVRQAAVTTPAAAAAAVAAAATAAAAIKR